MNILKSCRHISLLLVFLGLSSLIPAYAETFAQGPSRDHSGPFIGVDATQMTATIKWTQVQPEFKLDPIRVKVGYMWGMIGFEAHAYTSSKDSTTVIDSSNGFSYDVNFELSESYGAYIRAQEEWVYARLGVTWLDNSFDIAGIIKDRDTVAALTFALGIDYSITDNLSVNLDYTYGAGKVRYPNITQQGPGLTDPTLRFQGFGMGVNFKF